MRSLVCSTALALVVTFTAFAGARAQAPEVVAAADRLLEVQVPEEMLKEMAGKISETLPVAQRQAYVDAMTEPAFVARFKTAARDAMAKHFTVEELDALAEFYQRPVARSAMAKMGDYMATLMPFLQAELIGIATKLQSQP